MANGLRWCAGVRTEYSGSVPGSSGAETECRGVRVQAWRGTSGDGYEDLGG
jgi:hypothetical protein